MSAVRNLSELIEHIADLRARLAVHELYGRLRTRQDMATFMRYHVFAVWDFMCLLKGLQQQLTCVDIVWRPVGRPRIRRLVNELVLEEESDEIEGVATGHFELYLRAMREVGADAAAVARLLELLGSGVALPRALELSGAPRGARAFVQGTFDTLGTGKPHVIAAAFAWGREQATGPMFSSILGGVGGDPKFGIFSTYLQRHVELDGDNHAHLAEEMVRSLCGENETLWAEAADGAERALRARLELWSAILADLDAAREEPGCEPRWEDSPASEPPALQPVALP